VSLLSPDTEPKKHKLENTSVIRAPDCCRSCVLLREPDALRWSSWLEKAEFLTCIGRYSDEQKRQIRWAMYVERVWENRNAYRVLVGKRVGRENLEDQGVDGRVILKWMLRK
jgi:hypothetical protein